MIAGGVNGDVSDTDSRKRPLIGWTIRSSFIALGSNVTCELAAISRIS